jgi:hypothetical protein
MTHAFASEADIERVALGMIDLSLPKPEWTHAAHFATALWILRHRREWDAETAMPTLIRAYNEATGGVNTDHAGYHETITFASVDAARRHLGRYPPDCPLHEILDALMAGALGDPDWLLAYWTRERLFSVEARRAWVAPDIKPLSGP